MAMKLKKGQIYQHKKECSCFRCSGTPWNKGLKGYMGGEKHYRWGKTLSSELKEKISTNRKGKLTGDSHFRWKGDQAGYRALHIRLGKAGDCAYCCSSGGKRSNHWANLTGKYSDPEDYLPLCALHHRRYDLGKLFIWPIKESPRVNI